MAVKTKSNEIRIVRVYEAPVQAVWDAWTDPEQVAQWWGPRGFTLTTHSKDLKVGGSWNYTMHGPDGTDYPNTTHYLEVQKHKKLVYDHGATEDRPPLFRVTVLFSESKGKTTMDMSMSLATPEQAEEIRKVVKKANGESTWDRLAEYLEANSSGKEKFVTTRSFDAPIELMFEMWTKPEHFCKWLAVAGFEMKFLRKEIKPGGSVFYLMSNNAGMEMYVRLEYLKIEKPNLIVYTQQIRDENEQPFRHPMFPTYPERMLTTIELTEEESVRTRVTGTCVAYGDATPEENENFRNGRGRMALGWTGLFDGLEDYLLQV